jgi:hypothetical protein
MNFIPSIAKKKKKKIVGSSRERVRAHTVIQIHARMWAVLVGLTEGFHPFARMRRKLYAEGGSWEWVSKNKEGWA